MEEEPTKFTSLARATDFYFIFLFPFVLPIGNCYVIFQHFSFFNNKGGMWIEARPCLALAIEKLGRESKNQKVKFCKFYECISLIGKGVVKIWNKHGLLFPSGRRLCSEATYVAGCVLIFVVTSEQMMFITLSMSVVFSSHTWLWCFPKQLNKSMYLSVGHTHT